MKKILVLTLLFLLSQNASYTKDYTKLHVKEMQKSQKYSATKNYFNEYSPSTNDNVKTQIKDPKLFNFGNYKEISDNDFNKKIKKDEIEYAKISKFLSGRTIDFYNSQAESDDFYMVYRIAEKIIRANNLDFVNWRIIIDKSEDFNASSSETNCISINTGALDTLSNNENALALLIGHELAHSLLGHRARKVELIESINRSLRVNNKFYFLYARKKYYKESKKMELAADIEGARLILKAGYDINSARETLSFMNTLGNASDSHSTHPKPKDRLSNYDENIKYFLIDEWKKEGRYNIYESEVLKCQKSSNRKSIIIARGKLSNSSSYYSTETLENLNLRLGYKSYVNGEFEKSINYFKDYLKLDKNNYAVYLYISYAYKYLYEQDGKVNNLDSAKIFADYAKTLAPNNQFVNEQIQNL